MTIHKKLLEINVDNKTANIKSYAIYLSADIVEFDR